MKHLLRRLLGWFDGALCTFGWHLWDYTRVTDYAGMLTINEGTAKAMNDGSGNKVLPGDYPLTEESIVRTCRGCGLKQHYVSFLGQWMELWNDKKHK